MEYPVNVKSMGWQVTALGFRIETPPREWLIRFWSDFFQLHRPYPKFNPSHTAVVCKSNLLMAEMSSYPNQLELFQV